MSSQGAALRLILTFVIEKKEKAQIILFFGFLVGWVPGHSYCDGLYQFFINKLYPKYTS